MFMISYYFMYIIIIIIIIVILILVLFLVNIITMPSVCFAISYISVTSL